MPRYRVIVVEEVNETAPTGELVTLEVETISYQADGGMPVPYKPTSPCAAGFSALGEVQECALIDTSRLPPVVGKDAQGQGSQRTGPRCAGPAGWPWRPPTVKSLAALRAGQESHELKRF
jgi:hypothetical protein